jgi:hypothetical protein
VTTRWPITPDVFMSAASAANDFGVAEWASLVGAVAACIAVLAALWTVFQNSRMLTQALQPELAGVVVHGQAVPLLEVHNTGGSSAIIPSFLWHNEGVYAEGGIAGAVASGEYRTVAAYVPGALKDSIGLFLYKDSRGTWFARSLDDHFVRWPRRWWQRKDWRPDIREVFSQFYPQVSLDQAKAIDYTIPFRMSELWASSSFPKKEDDPGADEPREPAG